MPYGCNVKKAILSAAPGLLYFLAFLTGLSLSGRFLPYKRLSLDLSWASVLDYAFEHNLQFGKDIVFTYGPLGFLDTGISLGGSFMFRGVSAILWGGIVALSVIGLGQKMPKQIRWLFVAWFVLVTAQGGFQRHAFLVIGYGAVLFLFADRERRYQSWLFLTIFVMLALVKFTFFIAASGTVLICALVKLLDKKIGKAFELVIGYLVLFMAVWWAIGQHISNIPDWIKGSMEIAFGYNEAMASVPQSNVLTVSVILIVLFCVALSIVLKNVSRDLPVYGMAASVVMYVYMLWKHGFVRGDASHVLFFMWQFPLVFCLLFIDPFVLKLPKYDLMLQIALVSVLLLCLAGAEMQKRGIVLAQFKSWPGNLEDKFMITASILSAKTEKDFRELNKGATIKSPDLPRFRNIVADEPVDVMNFHQVAALANGLNYSPRPVIQGYSAYTQYLQNINNNKFLDARRPAYVIMNHQTIDGRFPTLDDSSALNTVFNNYVPIAREDKFLLMRYSRSAPLQLERIHQQYLHYGERIDISKWAGEPVFVSVEIEPSIFDRIVTFCYHSSLQYISIDTDTGQHRYRFIPVMGRNPFLISPLVANNDDIVGMYEGLPGKKVTGITFLKSEMPVVNKRLINITIYKADFFKDKIQSTNL